MGSKYKKDLERIWEGKDLTDIKVRTIQLSASKKLSDVVMGKYISTKRRLK